MSGHTKGPWLREGTTVYALEHHGWQKGREVLRNRFSMQVVRGPDLPGEEAEANARLAQFAPDMLEALRECRLDLFAYRYNAGIAFARGDDRWEGVPEMLERKIAAIDALIAKAGGNQ